MSSHDDDNSFDSSATANGANGASSTNGGVSVDDPRVTPLGGNAGVHIKSEPDSSDDDEPLIDFSGFIIGLGTSCMVNLGKETHPETGTSQLDLPSAREVIAILEMLEQKTRGNLDSHERQLLETLLSDLKNAYHEVAD